MDWNLPCAFIHSFGTPTFFILQCHAPGVWCYTDFDLSVVPEEAPDFSKEAVLLLFSSLHLTPPPGRDDVPSQGGEEDTNAASGTDLVLAGL